MRYSIEGQTFEAAPAQPGLYVVSTPIGNLKDISLRSLDLLAAVNLIACEDTRVTRKLLDRYAIATPLTPYHEHNAAAARPKLLARLAGGEALALVSDAGTPLVSDPGYRLVREAREAGHAVTAIPGASALLAAISSCGLPSDRFLFEGFLPAKEGARRARIEDIRHIPATLILYETGPRLAASLADLAAALGPREAAVCRELTKLHEEIRRASLPELARHYERPDAEIRGEFAVVIAPLGEAAPIADADLDLLLGKAMARLSVKDAVAEVASATGRPRRDVYRRALDLGRADG